MRDIPWRLLAAGALTAILLDLAFPIAGPLPAWRAGFAFIALTPLLVGLLRFAGEARSRRSCLGWSFLAGWLTGALWFGANCYWVYDTMHLYGGMEPTMAAVSLIVFSIYLGFWFGVFTLALAIVRRAMAGGRFRWVALVAIPFLWTAMEFALARIPQFPWDLLGYSQVDNGLLMRLAPWTGVYGISFVLAAVNTLTAAGSERSPNRKRLSLGWLIAFSIVYGLAAWSSNPKSLLSIHPEPPISATAMLVQPNLDVQSDDVWVGPAWDRHIAQFAQLGSQACNQEYIAGLPENGAGKGIVECPPNPTQPALIAWPESPAPFREWDPVSRYSIAHVAQIDHAPLIVGNIGTDTDAAHQSHIYNSATVVAADGHTIGRYDKIHLVPFGEYVPFRKVLFFIRQVAQSPGDMSTGTERKVFKIDGHSYGVFICYEAVFGDEVRHFAKNGAEALVNISDDGWYGDTSAPWQHLNMARMRAIENRRWILRDTNNGVTAAIDPNGTVRQSIPRHQVGALAAQFGYKSELTFYTLHGDWFAWVCADVALGITSWAARAMLHS